MTTDTSLRTRWRLLRRFGALLWQIGRSEVPILAAFACVSGLLPVASLAILHQLVDTTLGALDGGPRWKALPWLAALLTTEAFQIMLTTRLSVTDSIKERLAARAQELLLRTAGRLSLATFEQPAHFDQLQRALLCLQHRFFTTLDFLLPVPTYLLVASSLLIYLGAVHPIFPLIILAALLPSYGMYVRAYRQTYWLDRQHVPAERRLRTLARLMTERAPAAEIRLFGLGNYLLRSYQGTWRQLRDDRLELARAQQRTDGYRIFGKAITTGLVAAGLVVLIGRGQLSVGAFAAYLGAAEQLGSAFALVLWGVSRTDSDLPALADLFAYLDLPQESASAPDSTALVLPPIVAFDRVSFTYPNSEHPVLRDITLRIRSGERVALVGVNGAGKSTLAKLLMGLYEPSTGQITIDGQPLDSSSRLWWREQVSAVVQEFTRYETTVRDNIGFGRLSAFNNDAAIAAAAARSGAATMIATLPQGYATALGTSASENGEELSVGQWQTLAIARGYMRDGVVLLLDEPTAALDAASEVEVYRQFSAMSTGRTVLLISHRLGAARFADRIVVLEDGEIVEQGHHRELVGANGRYAELYALQASWYE